MTPDMTRAFERAINWLELDTMLPNAVVTILMDLFKQAVQNPNIYLAIWSPKNVVQVFGGKAVATKIPHAARIDDEMDARYGVDKTSYLALPRHGYVSTNAANEFQVLDFVYIVSQAYQSRDDEHRMELVAG